MKHLLGMLAAAFMLAFATQAGALTMNNYSLGNLAPTGETDFGATYVPSVGTFIDSYQFNLLTAAQGHAIVTDNPEVKTALDLNGLDIKLFDASLNPISLGTGASDTTSALTFGLLTPGTYILAIFGNVAGEFAGAYQAKLFLSSVPLPASFPLLAAALGILALVIFRKRLASAL